MDYFYSELDSYSHVNDFMKKVFQYMTLGILITAFFAFALVNTDIGIQFLLQNYKLIYVLMGLEVVFVWFFARRVFSLPKGMGLTAFLIYSAVNGITLAPLFLLYTQANIYKAFVAAAILFAYLGFIGATTDKDLSSAGRIAFAGLIALIIGSLINWLLGSTALDYIITFAGIVIFSVLTMYDTQKLKQIAGMQGSENFIVLAAFSLYLDFINLFLYLLRLFGRSND